MAAGEVDYNNTLTGNVIVYDDPDVTYDGDADGGADNDTWAWGREK